jgi:GntR family transcriptional regulator
MNQAPAHAGPPKHQQVADWLAGEIESGRLAPGDRVPTAAALEHQFRVAKQTVLKAMQPLVARGLISEGNARGGRFVLGWQPLTFDMSSSERLADRLTAHARDAWVVDVTAQGHEPGQLVSVALEQAGNGIARRLEIEPGTLALVRKRVRTVDGDPHNLNDTWYPRELTIGTRIESPEDVPEGVIAYMARELGIISSEYVDDISARFPADEERRKLGLGAAAGVAVLLQTRTGYTKESARCLGCEGTGTVTDGGRDCLGCGGSGASECRPVKVTATVWPANRTLLRYVIPA